MPAESHTRMHTHQANIHLKEIPALAKLALFSSPERYETIDMGGSTLSNAIFRTDFAIPPMNALRSTPWKRKA